MNKFISSITGTEKQLNTNLLELHRIVHNNNFEQVKKVLKNALKEAPHETLKFIFYVGDKLKGLNNRAMYNELLTETALINPELLKPNITLIPHYGRYDCLYSLVGTPLEDDMFRFMKNELTDDLGAVHAGGRPSLLGKWLKSVNTSSKHSRMLGALTAKSLGFSQKEYRKICAKLRDALDVFEKRISAKQDVKEYSITNRIFQKLPTKVNKVMPAVFIEKQKIEALQNVSYPSESVVTKNKVGIPNFEVEHDTIPIIDNTRTMLSLTPKSAKRQLDTAKEIAEFISNNNKVFKNIVGASNIINSRTKQEIYDIGYTNYDIDPDQILDGVLETVGNLFNSIPKHILIITNKPYDVVEPLFKNKITEYAQKYAEKGFKVPIPLIWNIGELPKCEIMQIIEQGAVYIKGFNIDLLKFILSNTLIDLNDIVHAIVSSSRYNEVLYESNK